VGVGSRSRSGQVECALALGARSNTWASGVGGEQGVPVEVLRHAERPVFEAQGGRGSLAQAQGRPVVSTAHTLCTGTVQQTRWIAR
jgi:hypothetical protein